MPSTIIILEDGIEVEVDINQDQYEEISDNLNNKVNSSIDNIQSFLKKIIEPVSKAFQDSNKSISIDSAKVTIGIRIGVSGNFILAKSDASANIQVEMTIRSNNNV